MQGRQLTENNICKSLSLATSGLLGGGCPEPKKLGLYGQVTNVGGKVITSLLLSPLLDCLM